MSDDGVGDDGRAVDERRAAGDEAGESVLAAMQFADSFLPAGSFTTSYGLEAFVAADDVEDGDDLRALLATYLDGQIGPCEMVALRAAHGAATAGDLDAVVAVDERLRAVQLPAEFRESSTRTGSQLCSLVAETEDDSLLSAYDERIDAGEAPGNYAVVMGVVGARTGMRAREAGLVLGYSFLTDLLGAAQRLLRVGHTEIQAVLTDCRPLVARAWDRHADRSIEAMTPFAPLVDVVAAEHERAERRLFLS
jgi:urease accessory protein